MKKSKFIIISGLTTTLYSLSTVGLAFTASANEYSSSQNTKGNLIAQSTNCRTVNVRNSLNVRQSPRGAIINTLKRGQNVYIRYYKFNRFAVSKLLDMEIIKPTNLKVSLSAFLMLVD